MDASYILQVNDDKERRVPQPNLYHQTPKMDARGHPKITKWQPKGAPRATKLYLLAPVEAPTTIKHNNHMYQQLLKTSKNQPKFRLMLQ